MKKFALLALCLCIVIWGASVLRCEILTYKYAKEFENLYKETSMIDSIDYLKILSKTTTHAKIYYVEKGDAGYIVEAQYNDSGWHMTDWDCVWSKMGTADGFVFPYGR